MRSPHHAVYVISVAAELAGMHPQTLRIYERRGLVQPARTQGGNRRYSDADIATLRRIAELAAEGMNLEGIRRVMALEAENARLRAELEQLRSGATRPGGAAASATATGDTPGTPDTGPGGVPHRTGVELVPLRQAMVLFGQIPSILRDR